MSPLKARSQSKERIHGKGDKENISMVLPWTCQSLMSCYGLRRNPLADEWLYPVATSIGLSAFPDLEGRDCLMRSSAGTTKSRGLSDLLNSSSLPASSGPGGQLGHLTGLSLGWCKPLIWKKILHMLLLLVLAGWIFCGSVSWTVLQKVPLQAQSAPLCKFILSLCFTGGHAPGLCGFSQFWGITERRGTEHQQGENFLGLQWFLIIHKQLKGSKMGSCCWNEKSYQSLWASEEHASAD